MSTCTLSCWMTRKKSLLALDLERAHPLLLPLGVSPHRRLLRRMLAPGLPRVLGHLLRVARASVCITRAHAYAHSAHPRRPASPLPCSAACKLERLQ